MTITPDEIAAYRREYKIQIEQHVEQIIQLLSLQPPNSPVHNVEPYRDGIRIPVILSDDLTVYVYALPWARGWSIFTTPDADNVYSFSWREVNLKWRSYQMPCYNPRDKLGPWHCTPAQIVGGLEFIARRLADRGKRRRAAQRRTH